MSKKKQPKKAIWPVVLTVLVAVGTAMLCLSRFGADSESRPPADPADTVHAGESLPRDPTDASWEPTAETPEETAAEPVLQTIDLGYGLELIDSGKYTGLYMEDGSNEVLSDVMMIIVENKGQQDIQLARISAVCGAEPYSFTLTNLAVGARAVLLEQDRRPAAVLTSAVADTCALFREPMSTEEGRIQVSGLDGMVNVKNISGTDISGDIYVYYKYAADDIFYGGVTFRVRVEDGLKAGELRQIPAGHFTAVGSTVVQVTIHE